VAPAAESSASSASARLGGQSAAASEPAWLEVRGLSKQFAGVHALQNVDFDVSRGQVHGLVGANGAGKSTLIRCLAGLYIPDGGSIRIAGDPVSIPTPQASERLGFSFIHQELNLVPQFSALKNMLLGARKPKRLGIVDWRAARREVQGVVERLGIAFPLDRRADELSVAQRWMVSIARSLVGKASMIAMDEPTASLSAAETGRLFSVVRDLTESGVAVLYVSHRLAEVLELSDTISVFRDGRLTRRASRGDLNRDSLVREIIGRDLHPEAGADAAARAIAPAGEAPTAAPLLEVRSLRRGVAVRDVSFSVRRGEVMGLGGLVGSGRTEVARMLAAADLPDAGEILLDGRRLRSRSVAAAVRNGIALVPEERRSEGLVLDRSVAFNLNVADLRPLRRVSWLPLIHSGRARARAQALVQRLGIKVASIGQPVRLLSGGNQQKILIARWLTRDLKVIVLDELSRGVDVGARAEIHAIVRQLAQDGTAVIAISSEIEELVELCDRIVVLAEGRVAGELEAGDMTYENVIALSYSHAHANREAVA
jgi:ribose transport system ATP-binding protein